MQLSVQMTNVITKLYLQIPKKIPRQSTTSNWDPHKNNLVSPNAYPTSNWASRHMMVGWNMKYVERKGAYHLERFNFMLFLKQNHPKRQTF